MNGVCNSCGTPAEIDEDKKCPDCAGDSMDDMDPDSMDDMDDDIDDDTSDDM